MVRPFRGAWLWVMFDFTVAASLPHLWCVLANCTMLASTRLDHSCYREYRCRDGSPDCPLGGRVMKIMASEHLCRADDNERSNENSEKAFYPKSNTHGVLSREA